MGLFSARADFITYKPFGDRLKGLPLLLMDMRHTIAQNKRGVRCSNCGPTLGTSANIGQGGLRCQSCGQFAEPCPAFCAKHECYWGGISGYDHCPKCREEDRIERARAEQSYVGHNMHPTVDARRR